MCDFCDVRESEDSSIAELTLPPTVSERKPAVEPADPDETRVYQLVRPDGSIAWSTTGTAEQAARLNRFIARAALPGSFGFAVVEHIADDFATAAQAALEAA